MIQRSLTAKFLTSVLALSLFSSILVPAASASPVYYSPYTQVQQLTTNSGGQATITLHIPYYRYTRPVSIFSSPSLIYTTPSQTPAPTVPTTPSTSNAVSSGTEVQQALALLNADRAASGLPALRLNTQLSQLANSYAKDMIARNFFAHTNPEGLSPFDRMHQAGISYMYAGENLAIDRTVTSAEAAFMGSSGHRANILNSHYTEVGLGVVHSASGSVYVVQEFIGR
ncbi:MAG: SCP-like extracellular [Firmicutes bacterium]|nr:SCP-like extracellular [Bacillota bacterium]